MDANSPGSHLTRRQALALLRRDRRAVTAIEYALIAGIMVTALVLSIPSIGPSLANTFNSVAQRL